MMSAFFHFQNILNRWGGGGGGVGSVKLTAPPGKTTLNKTSLIRVKANSECYLFQLTDHDFSSLFKSSSKHNSRILQC